MTALESLFSLFSLASLGGRTLGKVSFIICVLIAAFHTQLKGKELH